MVLNQRAGSALKAVNSAIWLPFTLDDPAEMLTVREMASALEDAILELLAADMASLLVSKAMIEKSVPSM